ncbi:AAA family ATPase [Wenzhouxiangella limi]|uniref:AAA family ATPase n=1 Tax=Wenzhouxiangella limi TaxID=2707351 RepID=A0A845UU64_9GAMM|nr:AAA family ATPase [Wenzhouxiangella limi]NDY95047.1 AAA family ATPase [Wenzhouxiangella limi]
MMTSKCSTSASIRKPPIEGDRSFTGFRAAIQSAGLIPPDYIEPGRFHRFPGANKSAGNDAGWCLLFDDGIGGAFGDWSTGLWEKWQARKPADEAERREWVAKIHKARQESERQRQKARAAAAKESIRVWNTAEPASPDHPYLVTKGIQPHGARIERGRLVIPARNAAGDIRSLQRIDKLGSKRFETGGAINGNFYLIGQPDELIIVAEGFATAASIHEATGHAVAVAFNAGNLRSVAQAILKTLPEVQIIIAADDDRSTDGNPGIAKATEAAQSVAGKIAEPGQPGDFNDLAKAQGLEAVAKAIEQARWAVSKRVRMTRPLEEIMPEPIRWLWPNRIARGKLTLIAGDPKLGKSLLTADLTARITAGHSWPVDGTTPPRGSVIFASAEDDAADTIRPRLEAARADISRVHILETVADADPETLEIRERMFNLKRDIQRLDDELHDLGDVVAVIIDPVTAYLGGTNSHTNSDVRELLAPLSKLAGKHGVAVIAVSHLNKGGSTNALYRVSGSLAFTATARGCWLVVKDQDDDTRRLLLPSGSNIAPDIGGLAYRINTKQTSVGEMAVIEWEPDMVEVDASEALQPDSEERTERHEAADWLRDLLWDGRMTAGEVQKAAKSAGFAWRTVQRARKVAGVETKREGFGKGATYFWDLRATKP